MCTVKTAGAESEWIALGRSERVYKGVFVQNKSVFILAHVRVRHRDSSKLVFKIYRVFAIESHTYRLTPTQSQNTSPDLHVEADRFGGASFQRSRGRILR